MEDGPRVIRDDVVNARGELTFAEQTRMTRGPVPGAERSEPVRCAFGNCLLNPDRCFRDDGCVYQRATPDDDPWYDVPPGPPVLPDVDTSQWRPRRQPPL